MNNAPAPKMSPKKMIGTYNLPQAKAFCHLFIYVKYYKEEK